MRFGTWNIRSVYKVGSITAAGRELEVYILYLVGVQEVSWDKGSTVRAGVYNFYMEKEMKIINWEQDFLYSSECYQPLRQYSFLATGCHY